MGVVIVARNKDKLEKVKQELESLKSGARVKVVVADFKDSLKEGFFKALTD